MRRLAVFGNPIAHSRSPEIHQHFAAQHAFEISCERILVPANGFEEYVRKFINSGGEGFNITAPYKQDAFGFSAQLSEPASLARAVNTISIRDGVIWGDNTDGIGLTNAITNNLGWSIDDKKVLLLGAGGAVSGVTSDLLSCAPKKLHILNRTLSKAQEIEQIHGDKRLKAIVRPESGYDIIINATSAGLKGELLDIPTSIVTDKSCCYDMTYGISSGVATTPFLSWSSKQGAMDIADGLGMLVEQAAQAFKIWFSVDVETRSVIEALRSTL